MVRLYSMPTSQIAQGGRNMLVYRNSSALNYLQPVYIYISNRRVLKIYQVSNVVRVIE